MARTAMKHIIFFDNGQSYDEHRQYPVCVADDAAHAQREMKRLNDWLAKTQGKFPLIEGGTMDEDAWMEAEDKRRKKISRLKMPYGDDCIRDGIQYGQGSFYVTAVPTAKA